MEAQAASEAPPPPPPPPLSPPEASIAPNTSPPPLPSASTAPPAASTVPQKAKRTPFTDEERAAVRRLRAEHPSDTQKELAKRFESRFNKPITQTTVCHALSKRYNYLDTSVERSDRKRQRIES